ncbi:metallophosphoesterase [Microbulbifer sp. SSSA005]|uniref:metallophosphoesterase n=1 Tax=Microbulbifer sp. SSSA005 TaxID=3243378 RepID=UPI004039853F
MTQEIFVLIMFELIQVMLKGFFVVGTVVKRAITLFFVLFILGVAGITYLLSGSKVIKTTGQVFQGIKIPIGDAAIRWRADLSKIAENPLLERMQGPVIIQSTDGYISRWFCDDKVKEQRSISKEIVLECGGDQRTYSLRDGEVEFVPYDGISPIAVVSDLEGDLDFFKNWARNLGIIDVDEKWSYGSGQLVIVGDVFDRGRYVYDLLWFIYHLEEEAANSGGAVHLLLGNHEQYAFTYRIKSVEAEHLWAIEQLRPYDQALAEDTVLGAWLRSKDVTLKLESVLFTHGGISPQVLKQGLSTSEFNDAHRAYLSGAKIDNSLLVGPHSPTQYRGYAYAMDQYPEADQQLVNATMEHFDVSYIVVGHSHQEELASKFQGKVYLVDSTLYVPKALVFESGKPVIRNTGVVRKSFIDKDTKEEPFDVLNTVHWMAFLGIFF